MANLHIDYPKIWPYKTERSLRKKNKKFEPQKTHILAGYLEEQQTKHRSGYKVKGRKVDITADGAETSGTRNAAQT
jgi:hypothetical protein